MAKLTESDKKHIVKDLMAGTQTVRQLAKKYGVANATIQKFKAEIDEKSEQIINAGVQYRQGLATIDDPQKVNAIVNAVDERTKHLQFFHNATLKNVSSMMKKVNDKTTIYEHKLAQETIAKGKETIFGKEPDNKTEVNIQNTNAQQNVTQLSDEDLAREAERYGISFKR